MNFEEGKTIVKVQLRILEKPHSLKIIKKWNRTLGLILSGFSILCILITGFIFGGFSENYFDFSAPFPIIAFQLIFAVVPMFFFLVGLSIFYAGIAHIFNQTVIHIENGLVLIKHGPFPLIPRQRILQQNISQIYLKDQQVFTNQDPKNQGYQLYYINKEEQSRPLMGQLFMLPLSLPWFERAEAKEIERLMENFMGIEDKEVMNAVNSIIITENPQKTIAEKITLYDKAMGRMEAPKSEIYLNESHYQEGEYSENSQVLLPSPQSLMIEESIEGLFIFKKWKSPIVIFYIIFGIIWNAIAWTIAVVLVYSIISSGSLQLLVFALFVLPFLGVGIKLALKSLAIIYNTTTIHVSNSELIISHRPIPAFKNHSISLNNILNIESITKTRSNKNGTYQVNVLAIKTKDDKHIEIEISNMLSFSDEEVQYLAQKLKNYIR
jgi:hypothetical protein